MEKYDASNKITCLIEMALKGEISSLNLDLLIDGLTPTLEKSRQIIRILLKEFERHQLICKVKKADGDIDFSDYFVEIDEDHLTSNVGGVLKENNFVRQLRSEMKRHFQ